MPAKKLVSDKISDSSSTSSSFEKVDGTDSQSENDSVTEENVEEVVEKNIMDKTEEELLDVPMKKEQEQFYTTEDSNRAIRNLVMFSSAMFVLPLLIMFSSYYYVFIDHFHLPSDQAMLYSAFCGVAVVFVIVGLFIYVAYQEEKEAELKLKASKKAE
ncbi:unnamed protein product [Auanema sp. JU1783]|nr:unnamed protein product [Auanema sp. JU1783]